MLWLPAERVLVASVPEPLPRTMVPMLAWPSRMVTVPVADEGETVAVKVTASPTIEGLSDEARTVVLAWMVAETTCEMAEDVEVR